MGTGPGGEIDEGIGEGVVVVKYVVRWEEGVSDFGGGFEGWDRVRTEKKCRLYSAGGHGELLGRRDDVDAKRWCVNEKEGRELQGNVRVIWERTVGRGEGWVVGMSIKLGGSSLISFQQSTIL